MTDSERKPIVLITGATSTLAPYAPVRVDAVRLYSASNE